MFCFQCEQTANSTGCTKVGVCGKSNDCAMLQDVLIHEVKCIAFYMKRVEKQNASSDMQVNRFVVEALFATITNVDFNEDSIAHLIRRAIEYKMIAKRLYKMAILKNSVAEESLPAESLEDPLTEIPAMLKFAEKLGIKEKLDRDGKTIAGLREFILHGLKGICAYTDHAAILGHTDDVLYSKIYDELDFLLTDPTDLNAIFNCAMEAGKTALRAMELLNIANVSAYGSPEPTSVRITPVKGKAILVSGHDLRDLDLILQATEHKGIHVYTHGEMLPCNAYPKLKKYPHLIGNYGGAWQDQRKEFAEFPGAILMTTNCIVPPADAYKDRIFTTGLVRYPGVANIVGKDFTPVIAAALKEEGFTEDAPEKHILTGFAVDAVTANLPVILDEVKKGMLKHFFLIGGCDGAKTGRNYYSQLAEMIPHDCVVLTLACGKYRFNKFGFGKIGSLPRLLDCGQCNDAYSAVRIALLLADKLNCTVNELPLSLVLSWYEQKAVAVLLALLSLGIRNIKIGPSLPASLSPEVIELLHRKFAISPITDPAQDLTDMLK